MFNPSNHRLPIAYSLLIAITVALPMGVAPSTAQQAPYVVPLISTVIDASSRSSPVMFIENAGQWPEAARFQVWGGIAGPMWLAEDAIWITVVERTPVADSRADRLRKLDSAAFGLEPSDLTPTRGVNIKLSFVDANPHPRMEPFDRLDTVVSYFIGNNPDQWQPDVPVWGGVRYVDLYPGVDLKVTSEGGQMVQRLASRPGADLGAVRLRVEGANTVTVDGNALQIDTAMGEVALSLPRMDGARAEGSKVHQRGGQVFEVDMSSAAPGVHPQAEIANLQSANDNITDLLYGTFPGGGGNDDGIGAVDGSGAAHVAGVTSSVNFPTTPGAFDRSHDVFYSDAFVVKINPSGSTLTYATFLGGNRDDGAWAIEVDGNGAAYVTGVTSSADFPTTLGAFDRSHNGGYDDVFMVKVDTSGSTLAYATFLGGSDTDWGEGIAVCGSGAAYVTGRTWSTDFPTTSGAFDQSYNGGEYDAFVVKLNPTGSALTYATFLGGSGDNAGLAIAVDGSGAAFLTGGTESADFPTTMGAFDRSYGGNTDAFVVKMDSSGATLAYATFLGGSNGDFGIDLVLDGSGAIYVTGHTTSTDFPATLGAFDTVNNSNDAFVAKLNTTGSTLAYATYLGGSNLDLSYGITVDANGAAYVAGATESADFPTTTGAFDTTYNGGGYFGDAFVANLTPTGSTLTYATFLGGSDDDYGNSIAVDGAGRAYVVGFTYSPDFPTTSGAFDQGYNGGEYDAFVVKLAMGVASTYTITGRVTDASGHGIPGVTVWAGFPRNTTTDANGDYTFPGLPASTYTITPDKDSCTFAPATQTVTIPPGQALPDFTSVRLASGLDVCILEPGDILLKAGAPVGDYTDLIRFWIKLGGSYFTHSALYLGVTSDPQNPAQTGPRIAEAAGKKKLGGSREDEVWETWLADTQWWDGENVTDWAVVRPVASSEAKTTAIQYARAKAADPNVVFSFLTDLDDEQEFYCSKLVWKSYQQAGVDVHRKTGLTGDLTSYWVTPEDLYFGSPVVQNMPGVDPSTRAFFRIYSPAHITLIDPLGRRTGFDSTSGGEVNEIPGALYSGADAQIESIMVAGLGSSEGWRLLATGYASGTYTLETGYLNAQTRNWVTHATTSEGTFDEYPVRPPNYPSYLPLLLR